MATFCHESRFLKTNGHILGKVVEMVHFSSKKPFLKISEYKMAKIFTISSQNWSLSGQKVDLGHFFGENEQILASICQK